LAHVDAGKTSLTERLLYAAGIINEIGSIDDGSTQTDCGAIPTRPRADRNPLNRKEYLLHVARRA